MQLNLKTAKLQPRLFNFSCYIKPLKMLKDVAPDNTKVHGNVWQHMMLETPMTPLWNGFIKLFHDGPRLIITAIHSEPMVDMSSSDYTRSCRLYQSWLEQIVMILY